MCGEVEPPPDLSIQSSVGGMLGDLQLPRHQLSVPGRPATSRVGGYDGAVKLQRPGRVAAVAAVTLLVGCVNASPSLVPTTPGAAATPTAQPTPTATPIPDVSFPLAVVTGITNLKATISLDELGTLASGGELVVPCGVTVDQPELTATAPCVAADQIVAETPG